AGTITQVPSNRVQKNKPGQLVFLVPAAGPTFLPGTYFLEVRARQKDALQLRSGRLDSTLTVI
nr:hypothetical protein [Armatimonadota bacterium]